MSRYRPKGGWVELWRKIESHRFWPTYEERAFTKLEAWLYLLLRAAYKAHQVEYMGRTYDLKPGELVTSERYLARIWRWSRGKVRHYLSELYMNGEATHEKAQGITRITVVKKAGYVGWEPSEKPSEKTPRGKGVDLEVQERTTTPSSNKVQKVLQGILDNIGKKKGK